MSKSLRDNPQLFGIFLVVAGVIVIAAITYVSRQSTESTNLENAPASNTNANAASTDGAKDNANQMLGSGGTDTTELNNTNSKTNSKANSNQPPANTNNTDDTNNANAPATNANTNAANTNADTDLDPTPHLRLLQPADARTDGVINSYVFENGNIVNVMPVSYQSIVLNEQSVQNEIPITVAGQPGTQYTVTSAKDGSIQTVIQVNFKDQLYDIRGTDEFLQTIDAYIEFN